MWAFELRREEFAEAGGSSKTGGNAQAKSERKLAHASMFLVRDDQNFHGDEAPADFPKVADMLGKQPVEFDDSLWFDRHEGMRLFRQTQPRSRTFSIMLRAGNGRQVNTRKSSTFTKSGR